MVQVFRDESGCLSMMRQVALHAKTDIWQTVLTVISFCTVASMLLTERDQLTGWSLLLIVAAMLNVCLRTKYPEASTVFQMALTLGMAFDPASNLLAWWSLMQFYLLSLASIRSRKIVLPFTVSVITLLWVTVELGDPAGFTLGLYSSMAFWLLIWTIGSVAIGAAIQLQRGYITAIQEREAAAIRGRDQETRRRVADERLRIARELHDSVAHHIAVVGMFTSLARTTLRSDPDQAEHALATSQDATRSVLAELQQVLRLLREPADGDVVGEDAGRGLADLPALLTSFEEIGLRTTFRASDMPDNLAQDTDTAAYWVVQEALTNAYKHGSGEALVNVTDEQHHLRLYISNPVPDDTTDRSTPRGTPGFGLVGMRERVRLVGGDLSHGLHQGSYVVEAVIPLGSRSFASGPESTTSPGSNVS